MRITIRRLRERLLAHRAGKLSRPYGFERAPLSDTFTSSFSHTSHIRRVDRENGSPVRDAQTARVSEALAQSEQHGASDFRATFGASRDAMLGRALRAGTANVRLSGPCILLCAERRDDCANRIALWTLNGFLSCAYEGGSLASADGRRAPCRQRNRRVVRRCAYVCGVSGYPFSGYRCSELKISLAVDEECPLKK